MTARRESRPATSLFVAMIVLKSKAWAIVSATEVVNIFVCVYVFVCLCVCDVVSVCVCLCACVCYMLVSV